MHWRVSIELGTGWQVAVWVGHSGTHGTGGRESLRGEKGTVTSMRVTRQSDNPHGCKTHMTEHGGAGRNGSGAGGGAGASGRRRRRSRRTLRRRAGGRDTVGHSTRARLSSSKIGRHFHMYILRMYIDTGRSRSHAGSNQYCNWPNRQERTILISITWAGVTSKKRRGRAVSC